MMINVLTFLRPLIFWWSWPRQARACMLYSRIVYCIEAPGNSHVHVVAASTFWALVASLQCNNVFATTTRKLEPATVTSNCLMTNAIVPLQAVSRWLQEDGVTQQLVSTPAVGWTLNKFFVVLATNNSHASKCPLDTCCVSSTLLGRHSHTFFCYNFAIALVAGFPCSELLRADRFKQYSFLECTLAKTVSQCKKPATWTVVVH